MSPCCGILFGSRKEEEYNNRMAKIQARITLIRQFLTTGIWRIRLKELVPPQVWYIKLLRVALASGKGFNEDTCTLYASALTFYSILSIVPILAMAFGVAKGFGFENVLQERLLEKFPGQQEIFDQIFGFAHTLLEHTKGGLLAGVGVAMLFWTIIKVLSDIETSFNVIWKVTRTRTLIRKFSDYLSIMLICPLLMVVAGSMTVFVATQITFITQKIAVLGHVSLVVNWVVQLLPFVVMWALFTFIYLFMPNTKVRLSSGIFAGVIAGTLYQVVQWFYVKFQVGVASYNAIYGSFAALPLFLVWLQLSWRIVLFGAELAYAYQHAEAFDFKPDCAGVSYAMKRVLAVQIAAFIVKNAAQGKKPVTFSQICDTLKVPACLLEQILDQLVSAGIVIQAISGNRAGYHPAHDSSKLTIKYVVDAVENAGIQDLPLCTTGEFRALQEHFKQISSAIERSSANKLLKDL